jgi:hypothetical protein
MDVKLLPESVIYDPIPTIVIDPSRAVFSNVPNELKLGETNLPLLESLSSKSVKDSGLENSITFRGKTFNPDELEIIQNCITKFYNQGRTKISESICEELNWRQKNGWLKDRACRDVLLRLEQRGLVALPPSKSPRKAAVKKTEKIDYLGKYDLSTPVTQFPMKVELVFSKGNRSEKEWNQLVDKFHYLGHNIVVGKCIKYLIKADDRIVGAIAFSSPSWKLAPRDKIIAEYCGGQEIENFVVNNSRFLILPYVEVKNLASHVLSLASKQVVIDWSWYYSSKPHMIETFIEPSKFHGTCYKAANWINIGSTKGYAKRGGSHQKSQEPKHIYLYALNKKAQKFLAKKIK